MRQTLIKYAVVVAVFFSVSFALILVNQTAQLVELAGRLHPMAGDFTFWLLVVFYAACVAVPITMWLRLPSSLAPPATADGPEFKRHLQDLGARLRANHLLAGDPLDSRADIEAALRKLDNAADVATKAAAARVFVATAVSQNGSLDAFMVLGLQSKLVWEVAHVYQQRPSLRDLGWLYGNVIATAFVAGEIDDLDLSEQIQPIIQGALGSAAGAIPGVNIAGALVANAATTGAANAFLTLRVGIVARRYCGALVQPQKRTLRHAAFVEAAGMLGAITASGTKRVVTALAKASGRKAKSTLNGITDKFKNTWNRSDKLQ